ncbi:MAG: hypothetical protein HUU26_07890 [Gemmatimonadaceae bacterium]|nr:hypothetical protein [Gemmatimonadaceae bacterium]
MLVLVLVLGLVLVLVLGLVLVLVLGLVLELVLELELELELVLVPVLVRLSPSPPIFISPTAHSHFPRHGLPWPLPDAGHHRIAHRAACADEYRALA